MYNTYQLIICHNINRLRALRGEEPIDTFDVMVSLDSTPHLYTFNDKLEPEMYDVNKNVVDRLTNNAARWRAKLARLLDETGLTAEVAKRGAAMSFTTATRPSWGDLDACADKIRIDRSPMPLKHFFEDIVPNHFVGGDKMIMWADAEIAKKINSTFTLKQIQLLQLAFHFGYNVLV